MKMSIPKHFSMPWGYKIETVYLNEEEMGVDEVGEPSDGYWDKDNMRIVLLEGLPESRARYTYAHEMHHVVPDWMDHFLDSWSISERVIRPKKKIFVVNDAIVTPPDTVV